MTKTTISQGGQPIPAAYASMDPGLRARCHARFPNAPWFAPIPEPAPAPEPSSAPWVLIHDVLAQGTADGLDLRQLAGGVYAVLVAEGLLSGGRA